jgi:hypothetical protein
MYGRTIFLLLKIIDLVPMPFHWMIPNPKSLWHMYPFEPTICSKQSHVFAEPSFEVNSWRVQNDAFPK